jgi:hypothetical protein
MSRYSLRSAGLAIFLFVCLVNPIWGQTWKPYTFKGTEHFKYSLKTIKGDEEKTGQFTLDVAEAGEDKYTISFSSALGENESSSTTTSTAEELPGKILMSLMMSGSEAAAVLGTTLFAPTLGIMFMGGGDLEVGSGWSRTEEGKKMSFKVESKEKVAGIEGYHCTLREDDKVTFSQVIAPDIGLPIKTEMVDDDGNRFISELIEFKK